ncbi:DsbA family protein [Bartonella sp. A05]|uniref:DsbA family protein n=1 Tax=Bartonella sp. A05 TaxID=2967261 RepID=UPI0022A945E7|nr:DsbA family protein [Bartonella sp. A05]MCZ2204226.1 DsbA family protein [Bartonella sp. A05]
MTHQSQHSKITFIAKLSITTVLGILICLPLSKAGEKEKNPTHSTIENLKMQILEDPAFLSKFSEKLIPYITNNHIQQTNDKYIQQIVKNYLLNNPEIMIEVQMILQEKMEKQYKQETQKQAEAIKLWEKEIFQSPDDAVLGNPNGKIVVVEFFDYNCQYCKQSHSHMMNLIKKNSDLRVVIKDLPILGADSVDAHTIAYAFRKQFPNKYFQFYKELLTSKGRANGAKAMKIAVALGANEKELRDAIPNLNIQESFKKSVQIASALNISGTPTYIIGDRVFMGAVGEDLLKAAIKSVQ